jgi:hypothetical protein
VTAWRATSAAGMTLAIVAACASPCPPLSAPHQALPPPSEPREPGPSPVVRLSDICDAVPDASGCPGAPLGPRCVQSDPAYGPQFAPYGYGGEIRWPTWHGETNEACLRPEAARYPTLNGSAAMVDACRYDGECVFAGCDGCFSYKRDSVECLVSEVLPNGALVDAPPLLPRWCGCVQGRCTMFTQ